jgi:SOS-response transcriptional repressor LexA
LGRIRGFIRQNGYSPTLREVAALMGAAAHSGARETLLVLQAKGAIRVTPNVARSVVILKEKAENLKS